MTRLRPALRLLAVAYAATGALLALQTIVLRAVPYDAPSFATFAAVFRHAFTACDVLAFVALLRVTPRAPSATAFARVALVMVGFGVSCSLLSAFAGGSTAGLARVVGAIEPMTTFGASTLVALALASVRAPSEAPSRAESSLTTAALVLAFVVVLLRLYASLPDLPQSIALSWLRWLFAVANAFALAALALVIARSFHVPDDVLARADAPAVAGYRIAGEVAASPPEPPPPSPATIEPLRAVVRGLGLERAAFIARLLVAPASFVVAFAIPQGAVLLLTLVGIATSVAMFIALLNQRWLASFRGGVPGVVALVSFGAAAACDVVASIWVVASSHGPFWLFVPASTLFTAAGVASASRVHQRAGELLGGSRLAMRATQTQASIVLGVSAFLACLATLGQIRTFMQSNNPAIFMTIALALTTFVAMCTAAGLHAVALTEATNLLRDRLDKAVALGSSRSP